MREPKKPDRDFLITNVRDAASQNYFYTVRGADGTPLDDVEDALSVFDDLIPKIVSRATADVAHSERTVDNLKSMYANFAARNELGRDIHVEHVAAMRAKAERMFEDDFARTFAMRYEPPVRTSGHAGGHRVLTPQGTCVDVLEAIRSRRSIGKVTGDVSDEQLHLLVEAGLWAPNHKLSDPVRYIALRGDARARLGAAWMRDARTIEPPPGVERAAFLEKEGRKPLRAPVLLVVVHRVDPDPVVEAEDAATAAAAVQNVLLAAHAIGLGAMWRTGGMVRSAAVMDELGLAQNERMSGIVYLGEPAMSSPASPPRDVSAHLTVRA
jgi:nitroreductase